MVTGTRWGIAALTGFEWSTIGRGSFGDAASAASPWPPTHSGSGPSSGTGEELRRHAPALAGVVLPHEAHAPADCGSRSRRTTRSFHTGETTGVADARLELVVDDERAGVDVADRVDQAHHPAGAAHVQPWQRRIRLRAEALRWKNESPVSTSSPWASSHR